MIRVGDELHVKGSTDRRGERLLTATWTVVKVDRIVDSRMYAVVARGDLNGRLAWITGPVDAVGRPGHPPSPMRGDDSSVWETEQVAYEDHQERVDGEIR